VPELPREGARRSADARVDEAEGLAEAIGIDVVAAKPLRVRTIRPATLLGKGQVAEIAELDRSQVSIKATTTERLGFTGRGEGIAAQAIATIRLA